MRPATVRYLQVREDCMKSHLLAALAFSAACAACASPAPDPDPVGGSSTVALATHKPAAVVVTDPDGAPVACATLSSYGEHAFNYVTDRSGIATIYEPDLMGQTMTFVVTHP